MPKQNMPEDKTTREKQSILAFTWYHEHDYDKLLEVSRNPEGLEENYQQWLVGARRAFLKYKDMGFDPTRVYLDVEEYVSWCELRDRPVSQKSREMFKEIKRQEFYRQIDREE
jgi:hypothetical protein